ncbi:MAG: immunoglobulin domain-containing protein [Verrucomicrobiota bacterium]
MAIPSAARISRRTPAPTTAAIGSLYSVAQGNGRFVVVGITNRLVTTNLVNWTAGAPDYINSENTAPHAYGVAFGQGLFVAVGNNGMIETSVDGIAWKRRDSPTNATFNAITYGAGRFAAVGVGGAVVTSTNGINWEDRSFNNGSGTLSGIAYGNDRFVLVGFAVGGNGVVRYSTNGTDWVSSSGPSQMVAITFGNGRFVAVGNNFNINVSANGQTWTSRPQSLTSTGFGIGYGGGRFVAVGTRGSFADGATVLSSTDTTNWVAEVANSTYDLRGVASGNGQLVMVGDNGIVLSAPTFETNTPPVITGQPTPAGQTVNAGTSVAYTATVTGSGPLSYRWLKNGEPLFNGAGVSGADTATLTLTGVDAVDMAGYQLTVWNDYGSDVSQSVAVTVNGAPIITLPPASLVVSNNTLSSFNLEVAGSLPLGFQWYFGGLALTNSSVISGANGEDLFITQSTRTNDGSYFVVITNAYGTVTSSVATLTVLRAPIVTQQPLPVTVFLGQPLSLTVGVDGTEPLRYQWVNTSTNIAGATNQTFSVASGQISQNGMYYVAISNAYGSTVSAPVQVTVIGPGILRSDITFTNVRPILDVAALPDGTFVAGGWFEDYLGLNVITKLNLTTLQVSHLTSLMPMGFNEPGFRTIATLTDGSFVVGGSFAGIGPVAPNFINLVRFLPNGVLDTAFRPANTNNISKIIAQPGGKFLALRAQDIAGPIGYITRYNADGTVDNTFSQISSSNNGFWGMAQQTNGTIWYGANGDGLRKANSDGTGATPVDTNVFAGKVFVAQDDRIYYAPSPVGGSLLRRRSADGSSNSFAVPFNNSVLSVVTLPDGKIVVGGNFTAVNGTNINYIAMLNEDGTLNTSFTSPFATTGGGSINSILLLADGSALLGTSGFNGVRRIQLYMPGLAVQFPPASQTVNRGTNATFTVNATGSSPLSYQWRFNGGNIAGATNVTLILTNVPDSAAGNYDVVVSNASGTNASASATLTILGDVQITSQPVGRAMLAGTTTNFSATATGATPITWQWRKNGTNIFGAISNLLTVANVSLGDIALYDVVTANAFNSITSAPAGLSVYSSTNGIGNAAGTVDTSYVASITISGSTPYVKTVTLDANNKVLLTGGFNFFGGQPRTNFVRLNADLSVDSPMVTVNTAPIPAVGLAGGGFALGGYFNTAGGSTRYGLTFYDNAGTLQPQPVLSANGYADGGGGKNAFAVQPDGKVLVGGFFTSVNGLARTNLARLNADGSTDTNLVPAALDQSVTTVALQPDGKILIGGYFNSVAGVAQAKVARLYTNGTYDATFTNSFSFSLPLGFKLQSDGKIIIHGQGLTAVGGVARSGIARLNTDGSLDTNFNVSITGLNSAVHDVVVEPDDKLVIAGSFTTVAGVARKCVARLNSNGTLDTSFVTGAGASGAAHAREFRGAPARRRLSHRRQFQRLRYFELSGLRSPKRSTHPAAGP